MTTSQLENAAQTDYHTFYKRLETKVCSIERSKIYAGGRYHPHFIHCYTENKLEQNELDTALALLEEHDLLIYPINPNFSLNVGFQIAEGNKPFPGHPGERTPLLTFLEKQLPQGSNFDTLKPYLHRPRNKELLKFFGQEEIREREYYDY